MVAPRQPQPILLLGQEQVKEGRGCGLKSTYYVIMGTVNKLPIDFGGGAVTLL